MPTPNKRTPRQPAADVDKRAEAAESPDASTPVAVEATTKEAGPAQAPPAPEVPATPPPPRTEAPSTELRGGPSELRVSTDPRPGAPRNEGRNGQAREGQ